MNNRYLVTCMPATDIAASVYKKVLKPLIPEADRLKLISYLDFPARGEFDSEIRKWIHLSNGVIAIINKQAHSVFYEIGVAIGLGKPVILLAPSLRDVPSMLRSRNVIEFDPKNPNSEEVRTKFEQSLKAELYGTFIDQRFQDHTNVLINQSTDLPPENNDSIPEENPLVSPDNLEVGINWYKLKKYDKAIVYLEKAIEDGERDADTYFYLADAYFFLGESSRPGDKQRGSYQKMQHIAREGAKFYQSDKRLRKTLGLSCMKLGDFDRAEKVFTELLREDPEYIVAIYNLACLYGLQQKRNHCLHHLSEVFNKNPEWRYLARFDPDFDSVWKSELIQRVMFPCPLN